MEFKFNIDSDVWFVGKILIESKWNLNKRFLKTKKKKISILIESKWNLN